MKKVLVTGARGFIGSHTLPLLKKKGFEIFAVTSKKNHVQNDDIDWIHLDLFNQQQTRDVLSQIRPEYLLHLAWDTTHGKFWNSVENASWVAASIHLLEVFSLSGGKRVVIAGSCAEYDWNNSPCVVGQTPLKPNSFYGQCKNALHSILEPWAKAVGLTLLWGRIFHLFGPGEHRNRFIPSIILGLLNNCEIPCSHGNQIRDFLYVKDVANAFVELLDNQASGAFNVGSGIKISLKELANKISLFFPRNRHNLLQFGKLPASSSDPLELVPDIKPLKNALGWHPNFSLEEALEETIEWWKQNESISGKKSESSNYHNHTHISSA